MNRDTAADDPAGGRGAAILVDFDNVFTRLWERDVELAIRFASDPSRWLKALARPATGEARRWLVARCYLNPSGWVSDPGEPGGRLRFYKLRPAFVDAGFEVIDCPPVTRGAKNAADIRIVMDVLDLLDHRTRFGEFVFVSGESDFTPLLHRLRSEDRLTAIVAPGGLAIAYASVADRVVGFDRLADMLDVTDDDAGVSAASGSVEIGHDVAADQRAFAALVRRRYEDAKTALNLSALSSAVIEALPNPKASEWFGPSPSVAPSRVWRCQGPGSRSIICGPKAGIRLRRRPTNWAKTLMRRRGRRLRRIPIMSRLGHAMVGHAIAATDEEWAIRRARAGEMRRC